MSTSNEQANNGDRTAKIRSMVAEDYERISSADDPFVVLNLSRDASVDEVRSRYARYEKFYRAENFQRFGDMDLTRKALDIRRAIGRAMVSIQGSLQEESEESGPDDSSASVLPDVDPDCAAMGDILFRDGLTFLKLRDLNSAEACLQRAIDYDPSRGLILAYLAYTRFKLRANDPTVINDSLEMLERAVDMEPDNADIHVLMARFGLNTKNKELTRQSLDQVKDLRPNHPKLKKLEKRFSRLG